MVSWNIPRSSLYKFKMWCQLIAWPLYCKKLCWNPILLLLKAYQKKRNQKATSHIHNPTATLKEWLELPSNYILFLWYTFMIHMRAILSSHKNIKTRFPDFSLTSFLLSYPWLLIQTSPPTHNQNMKYQEEYFEKYLPLLLNNPE